MDLHACHLLQNIYNFKENNKLGGEKAFSNKPRKLGGFFLMCAICSRDISILQC